MTLNPLDLLRPVLISCALIALGSFMDADASNLTRPANLFLSQAMIAFAAIYFIGPTMMAGMLRAIVKGQAILSASRPCSAYHRHSAVLAERQCSAVCRSCASVFTRTNW